MHHINELGRSVAKILLNGAVTEILEKDISLKKISVLLQNNMFDSPSPLKDLNYDENYSDSVKWSTMY